MAKANSPKPQPEPQLQGFAAVAQHDARVLILGSMPGVASLAATQYYGHPRNAFWPIMDALFGIPQQASYAARCEQLKQQGIALWDVLAACNREGSLDSAIEKESIRLNDFSRFFAQQPAIQAVFLNGGLAARLFQRHALPELGPLAEDLTITALPSTSPANASWSFERKLAAWQAVAGAIRGDMPPC